MKTIHVAVGVILNAQSQLLVAKRHDSAHQGGKWEFPGGKVEQGETVQQALVRELYEELDIRVSEAHIRPLMLLEHDYGDKMVILDVWWVLSFSGDARGREAQQVRWVYADSLKDLNFPEANQAIIDAILASEPPLS